MPNIIDLIEEFPDQWEGFELTKEMSNAAAAFLADKKNKLYQVNNEPTIISEGLVEYHKKMWKRGGPDLNRGIPLHIIVRSGVTYMMLISEVQKYLAK